MDGGVPKESGQPQGESQESSKDAAASAVEGIRFTFNLSYDKQPKTTWSYPVTNPLLKGEANREQTPISAQEATTGDTKVLVYPSQTLEITDKQTKRTLNILQLLPPGWEFFIVEPDNPDISSQTSESKVLIGNMMPILSAADTKRIALPLYRLYQEPEGIDYLTEQILYQVGVAHTLQEGQKPLSEVDRAAKKYVQEILDREPEEIKKSGEVTQEAVSVARKDPFATFEAELSRTLTEPVSPALDYPGAREFLKREREAMFPFPGSIEEQFILDVAKQSSLLQNSLKEASILPKGESNESIKKIAERFHSGLFYGYVIPKGLVYPDLTGAIRQSEQAREIDNLKDPVYAEGAFIARLLTNPDGAFSLLTTLATFQPGVDITRQTDKLIEERILILKVFRQKAWELRHAKILTREQKVLFSTMFPKAVLEGPISKIKPPKDYVNSYLKSLERHIIAWALRHHGL